MDGRSDWLCGRNLGSRRQPGDLWIESPPGLESSVSLRGQARTADEGPAPSLELSNPGAVTSVGAQARWVQGGSCSTDTEQMELPGSPAGHVGTQEAAPCRAGRHGPGPIRWAPNPILPGRADAPRQGTWGQALPGLPCWPRRAVGPLLMPVEQTGSTWSSVADVQAGDRCRFPEKLVPPHTHPEPRTCQGGWVSCLGGGRWLRSYTVPWGEGKWFARRRKDSFIITGFEAK